MEETMEALHDLVRAGKVRYIGASAMKAWEFQKYNSIAEKNGWTKFVSMQNFYNLIYREDERELQPYCENDKIGWITYSPLATGFLTGKQRSTTRSQTVFSTSRYPHVEKEKDSNNTILDRVEELAAVYNATNAQIAVAWLLTKKHISAPIIGISKEEQLYDLIGSLSIHLTEEEVKYLEEPYTSRKTFLE
jgi:aryl-alcohol dehydrogenase-like predicted oxidoreductase